MAGRIVQKQIIPPLAWYIAALVVSHGMRLAIALRRGMAVVQVREKCPVRRAEVLAIEAERIEIQIILKPHQVGPAVHCIDARTGKRAVESVDGALGQSLWTSNACRRNYRQAATGDWLHQ